MVLESNAGWPLVVQLRPNGRFFFKPATLTVCNFAARIFNISFALSKKRSHLQSAYTVRVPHSSSVIYVLVLISSW